MRDAARDLCAAITEHADLCTSEPENAPMIVPLIEKIRSLVQVYGDVLFEGSGWSNPLLGIQQPSPDGNGVPEEAAGKEASSHAHGRLWVSVVDQHALFVDNPDRLLEYMEARTGIKPESVTDALLDLCAADGWKPDRYPGSILETDWRSTDVHTD